MTQAPSPADYADAVIHLRPVQFVDTPVAHPDGAVARLAGGMQWFAAYEIVGAGRRATIPIARVHEFGEDAILQHQRITAPRAPLMLGARTLRFDQPLVAGILNATPDSFSDGGAHADPVAHGVAMAADGAALIDVGGESTRPGAALVWEGEEAERVAPVVAKLAAAGTLVSIDTRKATVMEAALAAGAAIVNDVAALLWDDRALDVVVRAGCPVVLMHSPDPKKGPHGETRYDDVVTQVYDWLADRVDAVVAAGVERSRIIVDPGIGFGKSLADNLALMNALAMFHAIGCPLMVGASRKRMIGALSGEAPADRRLGGSVALAMKAVEAGVQIVRVHDVAETVQAIRVWRGLRDRALVG